jgi:hypothetical protein
MKTHSSTRHITMSDHLAEISQTFNIKTVKGLIAQEKIPRLAVELKEGFNHNLRY